MIDLNKRNTPFAESIMNCGATFLNPNTTPSLCYRAAKEFVDEYEREEHEQTLDDLIREMKTYASSIYDFSKEFADIYEREEHEQTLDDLIREMKTYASSIYDFSKEFADIYEREEHGKRREEHEQRHEAQERKWSSKKQRAYGKLLDCAIGRMSPEKICDAAIELAQACKPEREKPKAGEVYRDIFDNRYAVFDVLETVDGDPLVTPFVVLTRVDDKGVPFQESLNSPTLEEFMNPTFKKE